MNPFQTSSNTYLIAKQMASSTNDEQTKRGAEEPGLLSQQYILFSISPQVFNVLEWGTVKTELQSYVIEQNKTNNCIVCSQCSLFADYSKVQSSWFFQAWFIVGCEPL